MANTHWTPEEEQILIELSKAGVSAIEATKVLKSRTKNGIDAKAQALGLSMGLAAKTPEIDHDMYKQLVKGAKK